MVIHTCLRCNKIFNRKSMYDKHKNKKNKCKKEKYNSLRCIYCNNVMQSITILKHHTTYNCTPELFILRNKYNKLSKENEQLKKRNKELKEQTLINIDGDNNDVNNINITNNTYNIMVPFGTENYSKFINKLPMCIRGFDTLTKLLQLIHFNKDVPENNNIYVTNIKDNIAKVYDGNKLQTTSLNDVINKIIKKQLKFMTVESEYIEDNVTPLIFDSLLDVIQAIKDKNIKNKTKLDINRLDNCKKLKKQYVKMKRFCYDNKDVSKKTIDNNKML